MDLPTTRVSTAVTTGTQGTAGGGEGGPRALRVGVVGAGFVGHSTALVACSAVAVRVHDMAPELCVPTGTTLARLARWADIVFVCVPTPMRTDDGSCDASAVEDVVLGVRRAATSAKIIIRSTVPPSTSRRLRCMFFPEFITETNFAADFLSCRTWVVGADDDPDGVALMQRLAAAVRAVPIEVGLFVTTTREAEMIKYTRNCFLAVKVAFFNEIASLCHGGSETVDFETVRRGVALDARIAGSHTRVPGPDGLPGFGGTCLPKDIAFLRHLFAQERIPCPLIDATVARNWTIDRPGHDWEHGRGRAVVHGFATAGDAGAMEVSPSPCKAPKQRSPGV